MIRIAQSVGPAASLPARRVLHAPHRRWLAVVGVLLLGGAACSRQSAQQQSPPPTSAAPGTASGGAPTTAPPSPQAPGAPSATAAVQTSPSATEHLPPWSQAVPQWGPRGHLQTPLIDECSGIVRGRLHPDVYWVHNDSGDSARIFAIASDGALVGVLPVPGARNVDWEDITDDDAGNLYVCDVGNNRSERRDLAIYVVAEPDPRRDHAARLVRRLRFHYPDQTAFPDPQRNFDCEAAFWLRGKLYLLTKHRGDTRTCLYCLDDLQSSFDQTLRPIDSFDVASQVTAASLSADGRELAVLTYEYLYLFDQQPGAEPSLSRGVVRRLPFEAKQDEAILHDGDVLRVLNEQGEIHLLATSAVRAAAAMRPAAAAAVFTVAPDAPEALARGYLPPRPSVLLTSKQATALPLDAAQGENREAAPAKGDATATVERDGDGLRISVAWEALDPTADAARSKDDAELPVLAYIAFGALSARPAPGPGDQVWALTLRGGAVVAQALGGNAPVAAPPALALRISGRRVEGSLVLHAAHAAPQDAAQQDAAQQDAASRDAASRDAAAQGAGEALCVVLFAPSGGDWSFGGGWAMRGPLNPFLWGQLAGSQRRS